MAVQDWSTTPSANTTIDGLNISEGSPPGNMNNGLRSVMASVRVMYDNLPSVDALVPKVDAVFSNQPKVSGRGALLHHNNPANSSGRVFIQADGAAVPAMQNGDILLTYK